MAKLLSLATVASLPLLALCSPVPAPEDASAPAAAPTTTPDGKPLYYLKTSVTSGSQDKKDLYVQTFHTGAGISDAVLVPWDSQGKPFAGYLTENTTWAFPSSNLVWGLTMATDTNYAGWEPVTINVAEAASEGMYFNQTEGAGLRYNNQFRYGPTNSSEFETWLGKLLANYPFDALI
jgi:hypothetical protein